MEVVLQPANTQVTGFNTTFTSDLKVGDFITIPSVNAGGADLSTRVTAIGSNTNLTISPVVQTSQTTVPIVRNRNQLRDQEKNLLLRKLRKDVIKTLKTDANAGVSQTVQTYRQTFVTTTTAAGEINLTAGSNETFSAKSNTDCVVTIITV